MPINMYLCVKSADVYTLNKAARLKLQLHVLLVDNLTLDYCD